MMQKYVRACQILGNGDFKSGRDFILKLAERTEYARKKHRIFAEGKYQALGVVHDEYKELEKAILENEGEDRERDEVLDLEVTSLRFYNREYEK